MDIISHKRCHKCHTDKPLSEFNKNKTKRDGLASTCKDCLKQYRVANREQLLEQKRDWYRANRERILEQRREYIRATREQRLEYRQSNRERIRVWMQGYREANRERLREYEREYRDANPHIYVAARHRRRARKSILPNDFTAEHMAACLEYFNHTCAVCGSQLQDLFGDVCLHWDHWLPLSSPDCPGTTPANMICLCNGCNQSKSAKLPDEWLNDKFGARKAKRILTRIEQYFDSLIL